MIRVAICDDNEFDLSRLRTALANCGIPLAITEYTSGETLLWDVETEKACFDIYLLDIYLTGINGVEIARRIRVLDEQALLVFVSSSEDFYREAFDVYALYYLLKPVEQAALNALMKKATLGMERQRKMTLPITYRGRTSVLRYDEIEYISSANHALCFHLRDGGERRCYGKLDEIISQLKSGSFIRCHQSYIVNLRYVLERVVEGFRMQHTVVPISRAYAEEAQEAFNQYLFGAFEQT